MSTSLLSLPLGLITGSTQLKPRGQRSSYAINQGRPISQKRKEDEKLEKLVTKGVVFQTSPHLPSRKMGCKARPPPGPPPGPPPRPSPRPPPRLPPRPPPRTAYSLRITDQFPSKAMQDAAQQKPGRNGKCFWERRSGSVRSSFSFLLTVLITLWEREKLPPFSPGCWVTRNHIQT